MSDWANVVAGETYFLRVAAGTERVQSDGTLNQLGCFSFVAELRAAITGRVNDADTGAGIGAPR